MHVDRSKDDWLSLFRAKLPGYDPELQKGDCTLDADAANNACRFFPTMLTFTEGKQFSGQPFKLEEWQAAVIGCAFGWKKPNGLRRYREVMLYVPRKNGKSPLLAGLVLLVAFCDGEPGAQIYSAAAEREQAALVYRHAKQMVLNNEKMSDATTIYKTFKSMEFPDNCTYKALSADADTKHGFNSHFIVVDELHALPNRDLVDVLMTSTGTRQQPMTWYITTADFKRESICNETYKRACAVRDNKGDPSRPGYDPSFLPVIFEAPKDSDWTDEAIWKVANPNLDVSIRLDYLRDECRAAIETPTRRNTFKRLHLNMQTDQDICWLPMEKWDECGGVPVSAESLKGKECFGGLDLSTTTDITAFSLVFPEDEGYVCLPFFWVPEQGARLREKRDKVPYYQWTEDGYVQATEGNVIDYDVIHERIRELSEIYNIRKIAIDRWNATQLATQLKGDGFEVEFFGQGFASMSAPAKELERVIVAGKFAHGNNPVLRWMASNAAAETDAAGNVKPSKKKSTERIDGIVATVMAIAMANATPDEEESVYDSRGLLFIGGGDG